MELQIIVGVAAGFVGAGIAYFAFAVPMKARASKAEARTIEMEERIESGRTEREALAVEKAAVEVEARRSQQLEQEVGKLRSQLETVNGELAETRATLETERKSHAARVEELERMGVEIERKFTALAAEALGKTSENFLKLASEQKFPLRWPPFAKGASR